MDLGRPQGGLIIDSKPGKRWQLILNQVLMTFTFIINTISIVTVILLINKYGLHYSPTSSGLSIVLDGDESNNSSTSDIIKVNKDVYLEQLIMAARLRIKSINNDHILITSGYGSSEIPQPGIFLTHDYVTMQAAYIGSSSKDEFVMKLDRELDRVHATGSCRNLRSIRSVVGLQEEEEEAAGISIDSEDDELELSGNLGLLVHSRDVRLKSKESITIESKEDVIDLRSPGGLYLPNLPILNGESEFSSDSEAHHQEGSQSDRPEGDKRRQLRIGKLDGLLSQVQI